VIETSAAAASSPSAPQDGATGGTPGRTNRQSGEVFAGLAPVRRRLVLAVLVVVALAAAAVGVVLFVPSGTAGANLQHDSVNPPSAE
jgi:hypothetical protein